MAIPQAQGVELWVRGFGDLCRNSFLMEGPCPDVDILRRRILPPGEPERPLTALKGSMRDWRPWGEPPLGTPHIWVSGSTPVSVFDAFSGRWERASGPFDRCHITFIPKDKP